MSCSVRNMSSRMSAAMVLVILVSLSSALTRSAYANDFPHLASEIGLLINFSVPCDLNSAIAVPDQGGLLTPVLLAVGYQVYRYNGHSWMNVDEHATLFNKSGAKAGSLFATKPYTADRSVTFQLRPTNTQGYNDPATVTALPTKNVQQAFSIPLQLLKVTKSVNQSDYYYSDYVQRFGTQTGLPPSSNYPAKAGDIFKSRFSAFYAFFLPFDLSPQLATRVPRCGDERFYGLQFR